MPFLISASVLVLAACGGPAGQERGPGEDRPGGTRPETTGAPEGTDGPSERLAGTAWSLTELEGRGLIEGTGISLSFRRGGLGGSAGCNHYNAERVELDEGKVEISAISATEMACGKTAGGVMAQEQRYLRALGGAATYRVREGRLEIRNDAGEKTLLFEKEAG